MSDRPKMRIILFLKRPGFRNSLAVQWLGLRASIAGSHKLHSMARGEKIKGQGSGLVRTIFFKSANVKGRKTVEMLQIK